MSLIIQTQLTNWIKDIGMSAFAYKYLECVEVGCDLEIVIVKTVYFVFQNNQRSRTKCHHETIPRKRWDEFCGRTRERVIRQGI